MLTFWLATILVTPAFCLTFFYNQVSDTEWCEAE